MSRVERGSRVYSRLCNEGPLTYDELGTNDINYQLRQDGVCRFRLMSGPGSIESGMVNQQYVVYIDGKHAPATVLTKWLDANEHIVERLSDESLYRKVCRFGTEWKPAARELIDADFSNRGGERTVGGECPICGGEYPRHLRDHLPCDGVGGDET